MSSDNNLCGSTLVDNSQSGADVDRRLLTYIGSPEDDFAEAGRSIALDGLERVEFGRADDRRFTFVNDGTVLRVGVPLPWVSGEHATVLLQDSGMSLIDRGSRNGTLLEGRAIRGEIPLAQGEVFEAGRSFWLIRSAPAGMGAAPNLETTGSAHPRVRGALRALERLAPTSVPLLLIGETGTGKDYVARAIHARTGRSGPFVATNVMVGSIDKVLFGDGQRPGVIESARGGTLFLDEVGELPLDAQGKLVSSLMANFPAHPKPLDLGPNHVRLVTASTRDLRAMVATETFRADLYARIAGFEARLLPIRERRDDMGLLLRAIARRGDGTMARIAPEVFRDMLLHHWPFNIRELQHTVTAAIAMSSGGINRERWAQTMWGKDVPSPARIQAVRQALVQQLAAHRGDTHAVAESLKCGPEDIDRWLTRFELRPERYAFPS